MPARARAAINMVIPVIFILENTPPIWRISERCVAWMTLPAQRNRSALKNAWLIRWNNDTPTASLASTIPSVPIPSIIYPSWDMVENASTRLRSFITIPIVEANNAVNPPTIATTRSEFGAARNIGNVRATRYTPAVTIVAAWMRADTVVGPSIASGSQTCNGNWPDLPTAPPKNRSVMIVSEPDGISAMCVNIVLNWSRYVPSESPSFVISAKRIMMPARNMTSPTRVVKNAFLLAAAADGFLNQNPMSKYEHNPTSSHAMKNWRILSDKITASIAAVNSAVSAKYRAFPGSCDI